MNQRPVPRSLYGNYFRRFSGQTWIKAEVVHDYGEESRDKATAGSERRTAYRPRGGERSMSPRPDGRKTEQEMIIKESLGGESTRQRETKKGMSLKEIQRLSEVVDAMEGAFRPRHKAIFSSKIVNRKNASKVKISCWP